MEVTGLVLSMGEKSTQRAIESLKKQTVPCKEIVVVENMSPFYRAMNKGIKKVKTPFFVQCDADMVLDPDCVETMLKFVRKDIGIIIGYLNDDLLERIQAVKMFRSECFKHVRFSNHVSPDTDYIYRLKQKGWDYCFARRQKSRYDHKPEVLGAHKPEYTPLYTYEKFKLEGSRMRDRGVFQEFLGYIDKLGKNPHPMAPVALVGICQGIVSARSKDGLMRYKKKKDFKLFEQYMNSKKVRDDFLISRNDAKEES